MIFYSYIWLVGNFIAPNMAGMVELVYTTPSFWLGILLVPVIALVPDIMYKSLWTTIRPTEEDKVNINVNVLQFFAKILKLVRFKKLTKSRKNEDFEGFLTNF